MTTKNSTTTTTTTIRMTCDTCKSWERNISEIDQFFGGCRTKNKYTTCANMCPKWKRDTERYPLS